jgi:nucleotide-binding universal stress UspA family protein
MATARILVAYDGSPHAADALELGRRLAAATDGSLELAHVHHTVPVPIGGEASHAGRETFVSRHSESLLDRAAEHAGLPDAPRHVVAATTTATGLRELDAREQFEVIVFGSAHNATPGRVHPGSAARRLLQSGPAALAFAPVGYASVDPHVGGVVGISDDDEQGTARRTAEAIAARRGTSVVESPADADLIVVGSRPGAPDRLVQISPAAERTIQRAGVPIIVVPRGRAIFEAELAAV